MIISTDMSLDANYFNNNIVQFEPLMEYWSFEAELRRGTNPQLGLKLTSISKTEERTKIEYSKEKAKQNLEMVNFNISNPFIQSLGDVFDVLNKDYYELEDLMNKETYSPYWIINETGRRLTISFEDVISDFTLAHIQLLLSLRLQMK